MSKPIRVEFEGAWYHVTNRSLRHIQAFRCAEDYADFLRHLREASERYRIEVHAYCLLPGSYHLLIRTPVANLGRAMRHINGVYTGDYQSRHGLEGPVFRGRYQAIVVEPTYVPAVSRYIHRRPVDQEPPLVDDPVAWERSSAAEYCGHRSAPEWLHLGAVSQAEGVGDPGGEYRGYLDAGIDAELEAFYGRRRPAAVLGSHAFRGDVLQRARTSEEAPTSSRRAFRPFEEILQAVERVTGCPHAEIMARAPRGGSPNRARPLAMWLCQQQGGWTLKEIGLAFGGIHYSSVAQAIRRIKQRSEQEPDCARLVAQAWSSGDGANEEPTTRPVQTIPTERRKQSSLLAQNQNDKTRAYQVTSPGVPATAPAPSPGATVAPETRQAVLDYLENLGGDLPAPDPQPLEELEIPEGQGPTPQQGRAEPGPSPQNPSDPEPVPTADKGTEPEDSADDDGAIETMFELARSYIEFGDRESAIEVLEEVTESGDAAQRKRANELKQQVLT